ncbi:MAG: 3-deoxy-manno-octulosonate cytidylyltransferase, partial [Bacteroidia bacterium]|nr:3-deoxy-manno-octulosonate cytidylyltransferase [Bacteroidia bacterium]
MPLNSVLAVIPARYASTRFEGKPLVNIAGKSMIQRVYQQVQQAAVDTVIVATDDTRIFEHVQSWGGNVVMTQKGHTSGTDRCAEVAKHYTEYNLVLNVQGDEPLIHPDTINALINILQNDDCQIATVYTHFRDVESLWASTTAKLITDIRNKVLYFSRSVIPYLRNVPQADWAACYAFKKHVGIYGFKREVLLALTQLPSSDLEQAESLEQLRWLAYGYNIYAVYTPHDSLGVDIPADVEKVVKKLSSEKSNL